MFRARVRVRRSSAPRNTLLATGFQPPAGPAAYQMLRLQRALLLQPAALTPGITTTLVLAVAVIMGSPWHMPGVVLWFVSARASARAPRTQNFLRPVEAQEP